MHNSDVKYLLPSFRELKLTLVHRQEHQKFIIRIGSAESNSEDQRETAWQKRQWLMTTKQTTTFTYRPAIHSLASAKKPVSLLTFFIGKEMRLPEKKAWALNTVQLRKPHKATVFQLEYFYVTIFLDPFGKLS